MNVALSSKIYVSNLVITSTCVSIGLFHISIRLEKPPLVTCTILYILQPVVSGVVNVLAVKEATVRSVTIAWICQSMEGKVAGRRHVFTGHAKH